MPKKTRTKEDFLEFCRVVLAYAKYEPYMQVSLDCHIFSVTLFCQHA